VTLWMIPSTSAMSLNRFTVESAGAFALIYGVFLCLARTARTAFSINQKGTGVGGAFGRRFGFFPPRLREGVAAQRFNRRSA
jgi:hypothetical protein